MQSTVPAFVAPRTNPWQPEDPRHARWAERERRIDRLVEGSIRSGGTSDRTYWTMVHDFELAPKTTNRAQLASLGIRVPPSESLVDEQLPGKIKEVAEGLAFLNVFLMHTDHLGDRAFYEKLCAVLDEQVAELPSDPSVREYVDFRKDEQSPAPAVSDRDSMLPRPQENTE